MPESSQQGGPPRPSVVHCCCPQGRPIAQRNTDGPPVTLGAHECSAAHILRKNV